MKTTALRKLRTLCIGLALFIGCEHNPLTGDWTMALYPDSQLFPLAFAQYDEFLKENTVITGTADAQMVERIGKNIKNAAQKWLTSLGYPNYLKDYQWEYKLVKDDQINAWCMPGGKIVVYTGILPVTQTEDGLAVVMGHEVSHALLNHGKQRMSAGLLQELGAAGLQVGMGLAGLSPGLQSGAMAAYGLSTALAGTLPFSRKHESEADHYGLILMAVAGYNPDAAVPFWQRMAAQGGGTLEFLSTHPSHQTRINDLRGWVPEAKKKAAELNKK